MVDLNPTQTVLTDILIMWLPAHDHVKEIYVQVYWYWLGI